MAQADRREGEHWRDLRGCRAELDDTDAGLGAWHERARFCMLYSSPTERRAVGMGASACAAGTRSTRGRTRR